MLRRRSVGGIQICLHIEVPGQPQLCPAQQGSDVIGLERQRLVEGFEREVRMTALPLYATEFVVVVRLVR